MQRIDISPRPHWQQIVEDQGLVWHSLQGLPYWNESAYYRFTADQVDELEAASLELYNRCLDAGQYILDHDLFARFGIPEAFVPLIKHAWDEEPPALNYGRFDLGYDGKSPPKMFEYNCDTPTSLLEAAVVQWQWKEDVYPRDDQFNSLHDKLVAKWKDIKPYLKSQRVHFTHVNDHAGEDTITVGYHRDLAERAGIESVPLFTQDIGWDSAKKRFVDIECNSIDVLFHLYPWEWLVNEDFASHIVESYDEMQWIEPIWKMMWSNKALLAVLWELFPEHPNLLPTHFEPQGDNYVKKPLLAREGANVTVVKGGLEVSQTDGDYGYEGYIYQHLYELPDFGGNRPVIGSWIVDGEPAGMGIREGGLITGNTGKFVPHVFTPR